MPFLHLNDVEVSVKTELNGYERRLDLSQISSKSKKQILSALSPSEFRVCHHKLIYPDLYRSHVWIWLPFFLQFYQILSCQINERIYLYWKSCSSLYNRWKPINSTNSYLQSKDYFHLGLDILISVECCLILLHLFHPIMDLPHTVAFVGKFIGNCSVSL